MKYSSHIGTPPPPAAESRVSHRLAGPNSRLSYSLHNSPLPIPLSYPLASQLVAVKVHVSPEDLEFC